MYENIRSMAGVNVNYHSGSSSNNMGTITGGGYHSSHSSSSELHHLHQTQQLSNPIAISDSDSSDDDRDPYDYSGSKSQYHNHSHHSSGTGNHLPRGRDAHNKCCNNKLWCVRVSPIMRLSGAIISTHVDKPINQFKN